MRRFGPVAMIIASWLMDMYMYVFLVDVMAHVRMPTAGAVVDVCGHALSRLVDRLAGGNLRRQGRCRRRF